MKNLLSLIIALIFVGGLYAQNKITTIQKANNQHSKSIYTDANAPVKIKSNAGHPTKTALFSEGFEGTTFPPTGWTKSGIDANSIYQWVKGTDSHSGSFCAAVHWDQDVAAQDEWLISPAINLTGLSSPMLSFWWNMGYSYSIAENDYDFKVKFSADGGSTWKLIWTDDSAGVYSDYTYYKQLINLTAYDTCTNFKVAFEYVGVNGDDLDIDDIMIENLPDNRLELTNVFAGFVNQSAPFLYSGYSQIPYGQTFPVTMAAYAENTGKFTQTNVALHVKELNSGQSGISTVYPTLSSMHVDTLNVANFDTINNLGNYKIAMYASSDSLPFIPNTDTFNIVVYSEPSFPYKAVFSRDNNDYEGYYMWNGIASTSVNGFQIANLYQVTSLTFAISTSVVFAVGTTINAPVKAILYRGWDNLTKTVVAESDYHFVTSNEINTTMGVNPIATEIYFNIPFELERDSSYFLAIQAFGGADTVLIAANSDIPQPDYSMFIYDTDNTWYYYSQGVLPAMIRLNTGFLEGINEIGMNNATLYQNVPNPACNSTRISYELTKSGKVTIDICDLTGRKVLSYNEGNQSTGVHSIDVNLTNLCSGTYFYTLNTDDFTKTKKMIVRK